MVQNMSTQARNAEGSIKVVAKAAALLDALASLGDMTPGELAEAIDEPRSTVYRILNSLADHGYVEPSGTGTRYTLGLKLFALGNAVARRFEDIRGLASPAMHQLQDATEQTIYLAVRRGDEAVCIERLEGTFVQLLILPIGGSLPLHAGALSKVLLAFEPADVQRKLLARDLEKLTSRTTTSKTALRVELDEIRRLGYAISDEDVIPGIGAVGAPIFDQHGHVTASISIAGPKSVVLGDDLERICSITQQAGREISRRLGHVGAPEAG
jgi:DNA-binding IclR family transcriptional regulator